MSESPEHAQQVDALAVELPSIQLIEGSFQRIRVRKQDVVVVMCPLPLHEQAIVGMKATLAQIFPGNRLLILDDGMSIGVLAPTMDNDEDEDD